MTDHDDDDKERAERLEKARAHMSQVAIGLQAILEPIDAAGVLIGAGIAIMESTFDSERAAQYLREIADEIETDRDGAPGHA